MALACVAAYALAAKVELVLCVSADGHVALEAAACGCCGQCADSAAERLPQAPQHAMARGAGACSLCCVDVQVHVNGTALSQPTGRSAKPHGLALAAAPVAERLLRAASVPALPARHAPPPDPGLTALQSVVLLI